MDEVCEGRGRTMAYAVGLRLPNEEARVGALVSPRGFCAGQSGDGTGYFPSSSVFLC